MPPRQAHDPFTDAPLRPTHQSAVPSTTALRAQTSQQSLRSNASTRPRQQRDLFAPSLSRRPTNRATSRVEDEVLADPDSEEDRQQQALRRVRQRSPEGKRSPPVEEQDVVNRQADGGFLLGVSGFSEALVLQGSGEDGLGEEDGEYSDAYYASAARHYFASGAALGSRGSKKQEEEVDGMTREMMARLRHRAMQRLEDERWMY